VRIAEQVMQAKAARKHGNLLRGVSNIQNTNFDFSIEMFLADHLHIGALDEVTCIGPTAWKGSDVIGWMDQRASLGGE
jgi:hypothetical protein